MRKFVSTRLDPYADIARFYDLEYRDYAEDLPLYLSLAQKSSGPILDGGAGTGRVAQALAEAGHTVVGLDTSPAMLELAQQQIPKDIAKRITLALGDLRKFSRPERFTLALLAVNTFDYFATREEQEQALSCLWEHLAPEGMLVIALQNPYLWAVDTQQHEIILEWDLAGPGEGEHTKKFSSGWSELANQVRHVALWYDVAGPGGTLHRISTSMTLRWSYRFELEVASGAGEFSRRAMVRFLRLRAVYGRQPIAPCSGKKRPKKTGRGRDIPVSFSVF